jgi:twitching motility protein PilT
VETTPYTGVPAAPAYPAPTGYPVAEPAAPEYAAPAYPAPTPDAAVPGYAAPSPVAAAAPATYPGAHSAPEAPAYDAPAYDAPAYDAPAYEAPVGYPAAPAAFLPAPEPELVAETVPDPAEQAPPSAPGAVVSHGRATTEQGEREGDFSLVDALTIMLERGASDLHITTGAKPMIRMSGSLLALDDFPVLTPPVIQRVMYAIITQAQREKFEEVLELDFAYSLPGRARFRVNLFRQRDSVGAAFRVIPFEIKSLESLGIPPSVANFAGLPRGFVLVTGPTGSGKSTTLAALVDLANRTRHDHIMTVEDPIEFLHKHKSCLINQREVGEDTWSFTNALKHVLRQDPDIILVGEMRDLETISVALTAAETGHLVFATLHTQDAAQTIDRIIDVFPPHQQQQVRSQLAMALQGVVCQTLAKTADGHGRVVATEVLVVTPAVRNLIREGKSHQIYSVMQAGAAHGMHTLDQHLADLVRTRRITYEVGLEKCHHIEDFNRLCGRA